MADKLRDAFPGARRGIGQARSGGDVPDVERCGQWWVQVKSVRAPNFYAAMQQAQDELVARRAQLGAPCPYSALAS